MHFETFSYFSCDFCLQSYLDECNLENKSGAQVYLFTFLLKQRWFRLYYPADSCATCLLHRLGNSSEKFFDKYFKDLGDISAKDSFQGSFLA